VHFDTLALLRLVGAFHRSASNHTMREAHENSIACPKSFCYDSAALESYGIIHQQLMHTGLGRPR
jgi:hypothetical protein